MLHYRAATSSTERQLRLVAAIAAILMFLTATLHAQTPWSATPAAPASLPQNRPSAPGPATNAATGTPTNLYTGERQPTRVWNTLAPPPSARPQVNPPAQQGNSLIPSMPPVQQPLVQQPLAQQPLNNIPPATSSPNIGFPPIPTLEQLPLTQQPFVAFSSPVSPQQATAPNAPNPANLTQPNSAQPTPNRFAPAAYNASQNSSTQINSTQINSTQNTQVNSDLTNATPRVANRTPVIDADFDAGELIAVVGNQHILSGDMAIFVEPIIEQNRSRITPAQEKELRATLVRQVLSQYVQIKALYQEFFRDMAGNKPPKEIAEMQQKVTSKAGQIFFEKQVPQMMKKYKVNDAAALERELQAKSMSLSAYRTQFIERILSSEIERKYVPEEYEFSRAELLGYYQANPDEWTVIGRAKWRELCARFNEHSRDEAEQKIRDMGNQVYLGGKPFEAVAKSMSEGFTAAEGGLYDWTNQGSLKSKALDTAIFSLPLRRLSLVIEDDMGFHIIEVLEREDGHTKSFDLAQVDIRNKLSEEKRSKLLKEFHDKVMARTPIWTKWPEDIPGSRDIAEALGQD